MDQQSAVNLSDIYNDWVKFGIMFVVSQLLIGKSLSDPDWRNTTIFLLLGLAGYHIITKNLINTENFAEYKLVADDLFKFGTMFIIARFISGQSLLDKQWQMSILYIMIGFIIYNILTSQFIQGVQLADTVGLAKTIDDAAKWGTMLIVSQLLSGGKISDPAFIRSTLATIAGLSVYNLFS